MAWTTTKVDQHNEGGRCVQVWDLIGDSATVEIVTGLANIISLQWSPRSMTTTTTPKVKVNQLSASTSQGGTIAITGAVTGDELYLTVIGN